MKRVFVIDWVLVALFIVTAISGFGMHISASRSSHHIWHNWAVVHTILSVLFLIAVIMHIRTHWGWYKGWFSKGLGTKSRVTAIVSIVFVFISVTGIILIAVGNGANSGMGLWHYRIGILFSLLALGHIVKRIPILRKSLNK